MSHPPGSVLFVCNLNRVRSPMAASLVRKLYGAAVRVESCGLQPADAVDPMVAAVMQEVGIDLFDYKPQSFFELPVRDFEVIVALSDDAWAAVQQAALPGGPEAERWTTEDPTAQEGSRDMRLEAYRMVRRTLERRIVDRFGAPQEWE